MNSKFLKQVRSRIRRLCSAYPVRELNRPTRHVLVPAYWLPLNSDGTLKKVSMEFPLPATNSAQTQRGLYRNIKKQDSKGSLSGFSAA